MIVWKVTLQDFITQEDITPFLVETVCDVLQEVQEVLGRIKLPPEKYRLRVVERVGTLARQSCYCAKPCSESTGQGY